jgi:hypothetical protein
METGKIIIKKGAIGSLFKSNHWDNQIVAKKDIIVRKWGKNHGIYFIKVKKNIASFDYKNIKVIKINK